MPSWSWSRATDRKLPKEALIKSHRGRCGKKWPRARRLRGRIPAAGCNREANTAPGRLSLQPEGLKPFVDFCGVARSGETAAGIDSLAPARLALTGLPAANLPKQPPQLRVAQHSRLQKSANALQRPAWDLISASLTGSLLGSGSRHWTGSCLLGPAESERQSYLREILQGECQESPV